MLFLRSLLFSLGLLVTTLVFAPLALLMRPLPYRSRYRTITRWTHINLWWLEKTCRIHQRVEGRENIPDTPSIVLCKHESAWETLALQRVFSPQVWVLKRELLWIPLLGWGLAALKPIAIDRKSGPRAVRQVIEQGRGRLRDGCWVVIFPEGTRVRPGERRPYRIGGAMLAQRTGFAVVPVAHNSGDYWPRRGFIKRPGTIRTIIGPTIESTGRSAAEVNRLAEDWIESTVMRIRAGCSGECAASKS
ncbi:MAG: 1-acyl-sn-glycerol-3-phosphate acyltransferase [Gammaproteobacteria bacterium]|nr:1-acyl-sn-glycerol-3-phosphate acyltransferase [Gammaproteobacteria bacterium]NIR83303.1 1-acyl-sn-glycerol-3-phosphate acyltransferase [Gammaproteobacteria bacterium]NIR91103.1 1-acyl-sn-glycerol-3-phosphate acyltransferase [Gammaproteobacteria bacterium]NIU04470.1 1-acyl-sn-glycerol-3-phosphate acyltransferase [Gammaproteobacteria bacterium]NIW87106.1 1-acyl-sn-glycerol-3-phosphate acyltransferase [Gammaproteobacteria bacterium]